MWVVRACPGRVLQFTSFGPSGMVILDKLARLGLLSEVPAIMIDTLHLFPETYEHVRNVSKRYPQMKLHEYFPKSFSAGQGYRFDVLNGDDLWTLDFDHYAYLTKVEPTVRALRERDPRAWITGRRRSQGNERGSLAVVELDDGRLKLNPLADWTLSQVWEYIVAHGVPYNSLHNKGYASVGDLMNTRPLNQGEAERAGRFMYTGANTTECGMHAHRARVEALQRAAESQHKQLEMPSLPCDSCLELGPSTFEELVIRTKPKQCMLIEFYSPMCGHCQAFGPTYAGIAQKLSAAQQITPARMDIFSNSIPQSGKDAGFIVDAYPTMYLACPDAQSGSLRVAKYKGDKEERPVLDWLTAETGALDATLDPSSHSEG